MRDQTYTTYQLIGIEDLQFYILPFIDFAPVSSNLYKSATTNDLTPYPAGNATSYTIDDLLEMAGVNYTTLASTGGMFAIDYYWTCDLDDNDCSTSMTVTLLNSANITNPMAMNIAYFKERSYEYTTGGTTYRDYSVYVGFYFLINVQGTGSKFNFNKFVIQLALMLVCVTIARAFSDFIFEHMYAKYKSEHFMKQKINNSADFSDIKDGIEVIKMERDQENHEEQKDDDE